MSNTLVEDLPCAHTSREVCAQGGSFVSSYSGSVSFFSRVVRPFSQRFARFLFLECGVLLPGHWLYSSDKGGRQVVQSLSCEIGQTICWSVCPESLDIGLEVKLALANGWVVSSLLLSPWLSHHCITTSSPRLLPSKCADDVE